MEDITLRAIRILGEVDFILCEDTRETAKLLQKYNIQKSLISYNTHSTGEKSEKIIGLLEEGKNLALVSDAGTPGISDPGCLIISQIREHFKGSDAVEIIAIPGPSAMVSGLSVSGLPTSDFLFLGFLPHKKGRETLFKEIAESKRTVVFYESPHRILKTLESLKNHLSVDRKIAIGRELTKIHEQTISGTTTELLEYFEKNADKVRGEFVVMVSAN